MKKAILIFGGFVLSVLLFSACKKSSDPSTLERLQAKWNYQKEYYHDSYSGVETRDTSYAVPGDYVDFRTDGKVYSKFGTSMDTSAYSLLGDNKIVSSYSYAGVTYYDTSTIVVLDDSQLQVYSKTFDPAPDYYEYTDFFAK